MSIIRKSLLAEVHSQIGDSLARQDHRYTTARRQLVDVLAQAEQPMTLPDIVAANPGLASSSAYRNLDVLVRTDVIRRFNASGDHAYFELAEPLKEHHHHLICTNCGGVEDFYLDSDVELLVDQTLASIADQAGFTATGHSLDLHGRCADC